MPCAHPPSNETLRNTIVGMVTDESANYQSNEVKKAYLSLARHLRKSNGDQRWLLGLCSTMNKELEFFKKGYKPAKEEQRNGGA